MHSALVIVSSLLVELGLTNRPLSEPPPSIVIDVPVTVARPRRKGLKAFWRLFFVIRVGLLLGVLVLLLLFGVYDYVGRQARLEWDRPLDVALVLIEQESLDEPTVRAFRDRVSFLEQQIAREFAKYRGGGSCPIRFYVYGPILGGAAPQPTGRSGWLDQLVESIARINYVWGLDRQARVPLFGFDSRIYLTVHPSHREITQFIEGFSELGGRRGFVDVELDPTMVDFALFVTTHELFHTLGASDKYDERGQTLVPAGLANPQQMPLYPQAQADVMARGRPVRLGADEPPTMLGELGVGPETARELRWTRR